MPVVANESRAIAHHPTAQAPPSGEREQEKTRGMTTQFTAKRTNLKLDPFNTLTLRRLQGRLCFPGNFVSVVYFCFGLSADSISVHLKRIIPTFLIFKSKGSLSFTINYFNGSIKYMQWCFNQTYNIG